MTNQLVCIYHFRRERAIWLDSSFPSYGEIYTLIDVVKEDHGIWFVLAEIQNKICWHGGWWHTRFKPLIKPIPAHIQVQREMA